MAALLAAATGGAPSLVATARTRRRPRLVWNNLTHSYRFNIFCKTTHIDTTNENPWCVCILSNCCSLFFIIKYNYVLSVMYGGFVYKIKYCIIEYSIYLRRKSWSYYGIFGKNIALKIKYAFKPIVLRCWNKLK